MTTRRPAKAAMEATDATGAPRVNKLEARGVSHYFFPVKSRMPLLALDAVDVEVEAGRFTALVGPSGCGKSTLLRMFAGLIAPSRGEIRMDGKRIEGPDSRKGLVFQEDAVFPWLTVARNVEYGLRSRDVPKYTARETARHWIDIVGLSGFDHAYPSELSGGMRKRVDLARVYASDPEVLLMDEPFGALDALTKQALQEDLLQLLQRVVKTVVFVTHDLEEAVYLADVVVLMSSRPGRIREVQTVTLPRSRGPEVRDSPEFFDLVRSLRRLLPNG